MRKLASQVRTTSPEFQENKARMEASRRRPSRASRGRAAAAAPSPRASCTPAAASCCRASASSGCSIPARRSSNCRRWRPRPLRRPGAGRGHHHRHRHHPRPPLRRRRQRRHRQGRHLLPDDRQEARARAGDRAREPPAVRLPRRLGRRVPADAGRRLPRPRALRPHLLQPGQHVGRSAFRRSPW